MTRAKEYYNTGLEYFFNAISFSKTNRFGETLTCNVINMAAEYLLNSILIKNGIESRESNIDNILSTLEGNNLISAEMKTNVIELKANCSCQVTIDCSKLDINKLISALRSIKQWADSEFKPKLVLAV